MIMMTSSNGIICDTQLWYVFICVWIKGWVNNREAGYMRRYHAHYDVTVMKYGAVQRITKFDSILFSCLLDACKRIKLSIQWKDESLRQTRYLTFSTTLH